MQNFHKSIFVLNYLLLYNFKPKIYFKWKIFNENHFFVFQHFVQFSGTIKLMQQSQQLIPCFRRPKARFTSGFKSVPKLVRLTSVRPGRFGKVH